MIEEEVADRKIGVERVWKDGNDLKGEIFITKEDGKKVSNDTKLSIGGIERFLRKAGDITEISEEEETEMKEKFMDLREEAKQELLQESSSEKEEQGTEDLQDTDMTGEKFNLAGKELVINPTNYVVVRELVETYDKRKKNENGNIRVNPLFKVYRATFGKGDDEDEYFLLTTPKEEMNTGEKYLPIKLAEVKRGFTKEYAHKLYKDKGKDFEGDFDDYLNYLNKSGKFLRKDSRLDEESEEKIKSMDQEEIKGIIEAYLRDGYQKDPKLEKVMFPLIFQHDPTAADPREVMPYNPHSMMVTNSKVGKSFTAELIGRKFDDLSRAGVAGFADAENIRVGTLDGEANSVFLDEAAHNSQEYVVDQLLTLLEEGKIEQTKAGTDLITNFYGSVSYLTNPPEGKEEIDPVASFIELLDTLGTNIQAMASRMGVIVFDNQMDTAIPDEGDMIAEREELEAVVEWIVEETAFEHTQIVRSLEDWLNQEYPKWYQDKVDEIESLASIDRFWRKHLEGYRHARGHALRMAILDNIKAVLNEDYDIDEIQEDAEKCFETVMKINLESMRKMSKELRESETVAERKHALLKADDLNQRLFVKLVKYSNKDNDLSSFEPIDEMKDDWKELREKTDEITDSSRYWNLSRIKEELAKMNGDERHDFFMRYGIEIESEDGEPIFRVKNQKILDTLPEISDMLDTDDIEKEGQNEEGGGGSDQSTDNFMSNMSTMSTESKDTAELEEKALKHIKANKEEDN